MDMPDFLHLRISSGCQVIAVHVVPALPHWSSVLPFTALSLVSIASG